MIFIDTNRWRYSEFHLHWRIIASFLPDLRTCPYSKTKSNLDLAPKLNKDLGWRTGQNALSLPVLYSFFSRTLSQETCPSPPLKNLFITNRQNIFNPNPSITVTSQRILYIREELTWCRKMVEYYSDNISIYVPQMLLLPVSSLQFFLIFTYI